MRARDTVGVEQIPGERELDAVNGEVAVDRNCCVSLEEIRQDDAAETEAASFQHPAAGKNRSGAKVRHDDIMMVCTGTVKWDSYSDEM